MMWDWDDDAPEGEDEDLDGEEGDDPGELLARVERAFRADRARIRACGDVGELRAMQDDFRASLADGTLYGVAAVRGNDLLELIDERITDLKAERVAGRGR
jgi:hypothetical protein